jgi:hypothetical protein
VTKRHPCPCCGHRTLDAPAPGTLSICPVCFWEDTVADEDLWSQSNGVELREAQRNFATFGACGAAWTEDVRPPTVEEARDPSWISLDDAEPRERDAALAMIRAAFGHLVRGSGMRVYEAELADDYGHESPSTALRRNDAYQRYWEIPDDVIARHYSALTFFDPPAFRFHVAAYMSFALRHAHDTRSNSPEFLLYSLHPRGEGLRAWSLERFAAFDDRQAIAVVEFLKYTVRHVRYSAKDAQDALDDYWQARADAARASDRSPPPTSGD